MPNKYRLKSNNHSYFLVTYYSTKYMNPISMWLSSNDAKDYVNESAAGIFAGSGVSQICGFAGVCLCGEATEGSDLVWGDRPTPTHHHLVSAGWAMPRVWAPHENKPTCSFSLAFPLLEVPQRCSGPSKTTCCSYTWKFPLAAMLKCCENILKEEYVFYCPCSRLEGLLPHQWSAWPLSCTPNSFWIVLKMLYPIPKFPDRGGHFRRCKTDQPDCYADLCSHEHPGDMKERMRNFHLPCGPAGHGSDKCVLLHQVDWGLKKIWG